MVDALFFSVVTMTTVGYGDLAPTSNGSRFFTCFYMLFGVVFIFTQTQGVVKLLLEKTESRVVAALERRAERARAALERAGFYRFGSSRDGAGGSRDGSPEPGGPPHGSRRKTLGGTPLAVPGTKPSLVDATAASPPELSTTRGDSAESLRDSAATAHSKASTLDKDSRHEPSRKPPEQIAVDAAHMDMSHPAFHMEAAFPFYLKNSIFWLLLGFAVLLIGAATFAYVEEIDEVDSGGGLRHWSDLPWPDGPTSYGARYARAFYFCWVSLTTVGYGDVTLHSQAGRGWACLYLFVCVVLIAAVVAKLSTLKADRMLKHRMREMLHMQLDWEMIKTLDKDGNGIDKLDFVVGMLELLGLVEAHDVEPFMEQFDALDVDGSGHLDRDDLRRMVCENREKYAAISHEVEAAAHHSSVADDVSHTLRGTHKNLAALVGGRAASAPPSAHSGGTAASGGGAKKVLGAARRASQAVAAFSRDEKTVLSTAPSNDGLPLAVRSTAKVAPEPPGE